MGKYFELLNSIQKTDTSIDTNSRVLIIDSLNTFIRSHAACPVISELGHHVGGITGFLYSVGYAIKQINPTRVILIFDGKGGSQRRRKLFPDYKANRRVKTSPINPDLYNDTEEEGKSMTRQLNRLIGYIDTLPVHCMAIDSIEADDTISYLTYYLKQKYDNSNYYIMSTDRDFLQLIDDRVTIWSPTKKKFYTNQTMLEEFGVPAKNFLIVKCLTGDSSDNIPGIPGWGLKTIQKRLPILVNESEEISIDRLFNYISDKVGEAKVYQTLIDNRERIELNYKLMNLKDIDIAGVTKEKIRNNIEQPIPRLAKHKFIQLLVEDSLSSIIKTPDVWLKEHFGKVDNFAGMI